MVKFLFAFAAMAFGNIIHDRNRCTVYLISELKVSARGVFKKVCQCQLLFAGQSPEAVGERALPCKTNLL